MNLNESSTRNVSSQQHTASQDFCAATQSTLTPDPVLPSYLRGMRYRHNSPGLPFLFQPQQAEQSLILCRRGLAGPGSSTPRGSTLINLRHGVVSPLARS